MDGGYSPYLSRAGLEGTVDKMVLIEQMGVKYGHDRRLQELVLSLLRNVGSAADDQLAALSTWLESLPYRREPSEIIRNPLQTAKNGGDCDDFAVLAIAAATAIGLPARAQVVATSGGEGFHIRTLVGLPPMDPTIWVIVDPVYRSEPKWAMANRDLGAVSRRFRTVPKGKFQGTTAAKLGGKPVWLLLAAALLLVLVTGRPTRK